MDFCSSNFVICPSTLSRTSDTVRLRLKPPGALTGPRIFAVPGDVLDIVFLNNLANPVNIVPSGAVTNSTAPTQPGQTTVYEWTIGKEVRPLCRLATCPSFLMASQSMPQAV